MPDDKDAAFCEKEASPESCRLTFEAGEIEVTISDYREAFRIYTIIGDWLASRPAPYKDPSLGTHHGGADAAWARRQRGVGR
jgi:hypothetical protein